MSTGSSPARYLGALLVLTIGLFTLVLGARAVLVQTSAPTGSARVALVDRTAADAASAARPDAIESAAPASTSPTPSSSPAPTTSPTPTPSVGSVAGITFAQSATPTTTKCWIEGCLMWTVTADAACSAASIDLTAPDGREDVAVVLPTGLQVGGFAAGRARVVEVDRVDLDGTGLSQQDLRLDLHCLRVTDGGL